VGVTGATRTPERDEVEDGLTARLRPASGELDEELAELLLSWEQSSRRSRERRADREAVRRERPRGRKALRVAAVIVPLAAASIALGGAALDAGRERTGAERSRSASAAAAAPNSAIGGGGRRVALPTNDAIDSARRFAESRAGIVSFAVIDRSGHLYDRLGDRQFVSASVVKAPLLIAELDRLERDGLPLDAATRSTLTSMITVSDNAAADEIYYRVGDAGLAKVAAQAGMKHFSVSGYWANAQITAADMARFGRSLDDLLDGPHEEFANSLLRRIADYQRWGIPAAVGESWRVRFKGGWRTTELGALNHQFAQLDRDHDRLSLAVLSDGQVSHEYGTETVRGIAERVLKEPGGG